MDVTITQFRHDLFSLAEAARQGEQVSFNYKGVKFNVIPNVTGDRLEKLTPMQVVNATVSEEEAQKSLASEMAAEWERDWSSL